MEGLLLDSDYDDFCVPSKIDILFQNILEFTHQVGQSIIYDEDSLSDSDINWERVFKFSGDLTGYESGCNEFMLYQRF